MKNNYKLIIIGLITGLINGLLGSGGGMIVVPALLYLLNFEEHKAHATAIFIILPLTIISAIIYIFNNIIDFKVVYGVIIGGLLGSYIGAKLLKKLSNSTLKKSFSIVIIVAALRMIFS